MTNKPMLSVDRELLERITRPQLKRRDETVRRRAITELRALLDKEVDGDSHAPKHQGEPVACMIRNRNIITTARIAVDGKDHFSEWSEWQPSTLGYGRTVTDLIRNNPVCYEIKMLFEEQPAPVADTRQDK